MTTPLRAALAEDEPYNLRRLARLLREQGCEVVAELEDGLAVMEWIDDGGDADVLFVDIKMPGLSGLEVVAELEGRLPVVFVTAFAEHAVKAFEQAAVDYLLKPVSSERLAITLERVRAARPQVPAVDRPTGPFRFPVRAGEGLVLLELARTTHFVYEDGAVWAFAQGRFKTHWKTLAEAEAALEGREVLKGHRHLLIRSGAIIGLRPLDSGRMMARLAGGIEVEISRGASRMIKRHLGISFL